VNTLSGKEILQLKGNSIPRGLVPLKKLFDPNDVAKEPQLVPICEDVEDVNIGTEDQPKAIKISRTLSSEAKKKYISLMTEYSDVFAWSHSDLKAYDTSIIQHTIPIKKDEMPFKQKLRRMNPKLLPLIEKEIKKLFEAKIIVALGFSRWVANLVPVRKKNGEIRICIDFRNLNRVSLKDHYPLPKMDHILKRVVGSQRISTLDGFSGYNQVVMHSEDQEKTTFTTHWGTFMYAKMRFGLMNAMATFQQAMEIAFDDEKDKIMVIYLDNIIVFSKSDKEHVAHLLRMFKKCRKFGISLNPKKELFAMKEGKLLGHIISQKGIRIDPKKVEVISKIDLPRNKVEVQSFLGKVNFLRRFIAAFAEIVKYITDMLGKDKEIKWTPEAKQSFEDIKKAISKAPVLASPDFSKDFLIFSFSSEHIVAGVLLQKNHERHEQPIAFTARL